VWITTAQPSHLAGNFATVSISNDDQLTETVNKLTEMMEKRQAAFSVESSSWIEQFHEVGAFPMTLGTSWIVCPLSTTRHVLRWRLTRHIRQAFACEGGVDEHGEESQPSFFDYLMHFLTLGWKVTIQGERDRGLRGFTRTPGPFLAHLHTSRRSI
jgi:hypothetical protein